MFVKDLKLSTDSIRLLDRQTGKELCVITPLSTTQHRGHVTVRIGIEAPETVEIDPKGKSKERAKNVTQTAPS